MLRLEGDWRVAVCSGRVWVNGRGCGSFQATGMVARGDVLETVLSRGSSKLGASSVGPCGANCGSGIGTTGERPEELLVAEGCCPLLCGIVTGGVMVAGVALT